MTEPVADRAPAPTPEPVPSAGADGAAADRLPADRRRRPRPPHRRHGRGVLPRLDLARAACTGARAGRRRTSSSPPAPACSPRRSAPPPASRSARTTTPARSAPKLLGVPVVIPLAWAMFAYPCLLVGQRLARTPLGAAAVGGARARRRGTCSSTRRWSRPATGASPTSRRRCPARPASRCRTTSAGCSSPSLMLGAAAAARPRATRDDRRARRAVPVDVGVVGAGQRRLLRPAARRADRRRRMGAGRRAVRPRRCGAGERGSPVPRPPARALTAHAAVNARLLRVPTRDRDRRAAVSRAAAGARRGRPRRAVPARAARPDRRRPRGARARRRLHRRHRRRRARSRRATRACGC